MSERFDVVILGGGNAGFGVSAIAHEAGRRIAFVEHRDFGGTCPNRGCTPKKVLVAAAHALHEIERAPVHGIEVAEPRLDWAKLIDRERDLIAGIPASMEQLARKRGEVYKGRARFTGPNTVQVGESTLEAEHIVIATGSRPRPLTIPGAEHLITSDEVLSERELPREVVFIGGGVIAMEFSHVYVRAGAAVTILEVLPRLLPNLEADAVAALERETRRIGVRVETGVEVESVVRDGDGFAVAFSRNGRSHRVHAARVVNGAGRIADVADLDLDAAGIEHDGIRIAVDEFLRCTSNPAVWVCGDALVGPAQLSPLATYEGRIVGRNIVDGPRHRPDYSSAPSCVFTVPALASVGLTAAQARERGLDFEAHDNDMTEWFSGLTYGESVAFAKVLVEASSERVLGAHLVGHRGEELIHLFAFAMAHGITAAQMRDTLYAFPTFAADVKSLV